RWRRAARRRAGRAGPRTGRCGGRPRRAAPSAPPAGTRSSSARRGTLGHVGQDVGCPSVTSRRIRVIGIGAGGPEHLTLEAAAAVSALDAVVLLDKGEELDDLARLRRDVLAAHARPGLRTVAVDDPPRDLPPPGAPDYHDAV